MSTYVLILWLSFMNSANASANNEGAIHSQEFNSQQSCEIALSTVIGKAKYVGGVCVKK